MKMILIAAVDQNWGIGNQGNLLIHIRDDQQNFRNLTMGHPVILGRKTLSGFPGGKPLEGRTNLILTRDETFQAEGARAVHSREELFRILRQEQEDAYVIGGGSVYLQLEPWCQEAVITRIEKTFPADTFFPNLDQKENWKLVNSGEERATSKGTRYRFLRYVNEKPCTGESPSL